ncbi:hypothetical protein MMC21_003770 [Puttea exsequens]|nr:hypothetical protein [Puttea exsequens]
MTSQNGLDWVEETFGLQPRWTREPDICDIKAVIKDTLNFQDDCDVTSLNQGCFNKLFTVQHAEETFIMRVSLPVDPRLKTESEVATLHFIRNKDIIPVPKVIAHDSSHDSRIGFEWIMMEFMPGVVLADKWRSMDWAAKEELVGELAKYSASMFQSQFDAIGNVFSSPGAESNKSRMEKLVSILSMCSPCSCFSKARNERTQLKSQIGECVSMLFFWGDHLTQDVPRGPFRSSAEWLNARLSLYELDVKKDLEHPESDEEDIQLAKRSLDIIKRIRHLLPQYFPTKTPGREATMLFHDDLSMHNVLVDENGKLTAVVDWECVSPLPLWKACDIPAFLDGTEIIEKQPTEDKYSKDENGEVDGCFWDDMMDYEVTQLRKIFFEKVSELEPGWMGVYDSSYIKRDFGVAIENCNQPFSRSTIEGWLDDVERKNHPIRSLRDRFRP